MNDGNDLELYQDPLTPFTVKDTAVSLGVWPVALTQLAGWLGAFVVIDRFFIPGKEIDGLIRAACRWATRSVGIRVAVEGEQNFQPDRAHVIAFNHVSLLDTPVLVQSVPIYCRTFQEMGHRRIPIYGSLVKLLGQLPVQKGNRELNDASYAGALEMLRSGKSFGVFPEGHRTRDGRLGKFYLGGFRLAIEAGVPVVPAVTVGLRNLCPAKEWRVRPGKARVIFGEPLSVEGLTLDDAGELAEQTRRRMNMMLRQAAGEE